MKLNITRRVEVVEAIDIELPYYYRHDLMLDTSESVIYGKVEESRHTAIKISCSLGDRGHEFELAVENRPAGTVGCYMTDEYRSSEDVYLAAKEQLLAAVQSA